MKLFMMQCFSKDGKPRLLHVDTRIFMNANEIMNEHKCIFCIKLSTMETIKLNTLTPCDKLVFMILADSEVHTNAAGQWFKHMGAG